MIEFQVIGLMALAGLLALAGFVALGAWHRKRHPWNAIDEIRPVGSEGHTGALRVFYKGGRLERAEFTPRSPR